jgi:predicted aldo/keto reductase-like oxidoreductase
MIVQTKVAPMANPDDFLRTFDTSMKYLRLDYVDLLSLHGINHRQLLDWSLGKKGCVAAARKLQREGRCRFVGFSTHATTDYHPRCGEQQRVRLLQRPLVFRERP